MSNRIRTFLIIVASPFLFMIFINEITNVPNRTNRHIDEYCTWHCHNVSCIHWKKSYAENSTSIKKIHKNIFDWYVTSLHGNGFGLNYKNINLLIFIIGYPAVGSLLVWNLIRKYR
jgi:hypothetical protein